MKIRSKYLMMYWREILLVALYILPCLVLMMLGFLWTWQQGQYWFLAVVSIFVAVATVATRSVWRPRPHGVVITSVEPGASQAEAAARRAVQQLIDTASANDISSITAAQDLATRTVQAVANAYHPGDSMAWLNVTIPELLLMTEDISGKLRTALNRDVPVLRHLDISLVFKGRSLYGHAVNAHNAYRLIRFVNPASALAQEAKALVLGKVVDGVTTAAKTRVAAILVREIGEAAIRLYSGGYHRTEAELLPTSPSVAAAPAKQPLTFLIAGQGNAGKSSLLNALVGHMRAPVGLTLPTGEFHAVELDDEKAGSLVLVDSPGQGSVLSEAWLDKAREADLVLWVVAANRADRAADQKALRALRNLTKDDARLRETPVVLVLTHADRLGPPLEWSPPYDVDEGARSKEVSMRTALTAISASLGVPSHRCAIVSVESPGSEAWNMETLWLRIHAALPEARKKQLERGLRKDGWMTWAFDFSQSVRNTVMKVPDLL